MATFHIGEKTHQSVLPQRAALESESADTPTDGERRGLYAVELAHRGSAIRDKLTARAAYRRGRRTRNLRYRAPRFSNRPRPKGWLPPSLRHRVDATVSWTTRLARWAPFRAVHVPLRDAAAVNATRWALWHGLEAAFPSVRAASGGRTEWNRQRTGTPKTHTLDALCVGELDTVTRTPARVLAVAAMGRGTYTRTRPDTYGFPRLRLPRQKQFFGHQTGDLARAVAPTGKKAGTHIGRIAVRATGRFDIKTAHGLVQGIGHKHFRLIQRADGYGYTSRPEGPSDAT